MRAAVSHPRPHPKQKKLKRVQAAVKRQARKEEGSKHESFAALQLLHDPQVRRIGGITAAVGCCAGWHRAAFCSAQAPTLEERQLLH